MCQGEAASGNRGFPKRKVDAYLAGALLYGPADLLMRPLLRLLTANFLIRPSCTHEPADQTPHLLFVSLIRNPLMVLVQLQRVLLPSFAAYIMPNDRALPRSNQTSDSRILFLRRSFEHPAFQSAKSL
jgi:hypothetical protein